MIFIPILLGRKLYLAWVLELLRVTGSKFYQFTVGQATKYYVKSIYETAEWNQCA